MEKKKTKRFTFADAKQKIKDLELELSMVQKDLTDKDGQISKTTSIVLAIATFAAGFLLGSVL